MLWHRFLILYTLVTASGLAQTISLNPQQVSLAAPAGSTMAVVQTVNVISNRPGTQFDASVRYLGNITGWLSVSPSTATAPTNLTITANASNLAPGTYAGQVTVTAAGVGAVANVFFAVGATIGSSSVGTSVSALTFVGESGAPVLPGQTVTVTSRSNGPVEFTASASSSNSWLSVSPLTATTPATLTVVVVQAGISKGVHSGAITITPLGGNPQILPVTLVATGTGTTIETLSLSQFSLMFQHQTGTSDPAVQTVSVETTTGQSREFTASTTTPWLRLFTTLNPASVVTDQTPAALQVQVRPSGLAPGSYIGTVSVTSGGLPTQVLPVTLTVTGNPTLNVDPSSVVLASTTTLEQPVSITSTGSASLAFTASLPTGNSWLSVTPTSGSTAAGSAVLTIKANPAGLVPGTYNASVTLSIQGSTTPVTIPTRLMVSGTETATGSLEVLPKEIELTGIVGATNATDTLTVGLTDTILSHEFTAAAVSTGGWLTVDPFSGTTVPVARPAKLTVTANSSAVAGPGSYDGSVVITSLLTGEQVTVPVKFNVLAQAIVADPASLSFTQQRRGAPLPEQRVRITSNVPSTFSVREVPDWLRVSPVEGSTPATLTVWVPSAILPPGSTNARILVMGPNNELSIPVSLSVPELPSPVPTPDAITFDYQLGSPAPAVRAIAVNSTDEPVIFTAAAATESGSRWLTVTPDSGLTPATLTAGVNATQVVPGRHSGLITLTARDGSTRTVSVTLNVSASMVAPNAMLHAATLAPTVAAPGQIVTITGTGLGPVTGVAARPSAAGAIETRLGDVRVLFDGVPAPVLYVRNDQINAIVPYALDGRFSTRMQIENGTGFSIPVEFKVADSAPGIFTANGLGRGQAAALNSDFTPNSPANPAQRGSVVAVYGTGEGQTELPGQDGRIIATDIRRPKMPVTATVAGQPAQITYIGSAPGLVSGVFQANIRIPEDVSPGAVSIGIQVGTAVTQSGVTIAVR